MFLDSKTAVSIKDLMVSYGHISALDRINLEVKTGEFLGIIGPNGGGKSTLLKSILGLHPRVDGEVLLFGDSPVKNRRYVGYVPQISSVDKTFPITVCEVVLSGLIRRDIVPFFRYTKKDKAAAREVLDRLGLTELSERRISELSGGQFQKMLIGRAIISSPKLLLLDEPTANVDISSREGIYDLLTELNDDITIILVTHDLMAISSSVKSLACLNKTLIYHGDPSIDQGVIDDLYGCPVDLIAHGVPHRVLKFHSHEETGGEH